MTDTIQQLKEDIAILQEKLQKLEEIEKQPRMNLQQEGEYVVVSYNNSTYYRLMNETTFSWYIKMSASVSHPVPTLVMINDAETERLLDGIYYNHIVVKKEKEMIRQNLKTSLEELANGDVRTIDDVIEEAKEQQTEKWKEIQKLIDEKDNDKNFKNSLDIIKEWGEKNKPKTLYQLIEDWWCDVFCANSTDDMETCIDGLVDKIDKEFIPPSSKKNGYEWEKCLKIMREKLR